MAGIVWIMQGDGKWCVGVIGHGNRIILELLEGGWRVTFGGATLRDLIPVLSSAKWEGVQLAKRLLTECLILLDEERDTTDYDTTRA